MAITVKLGAGVDKNILGKTDSPQAAVRPLHPADSPLTAFLDDDHEIHVAVFRGRAPRVRAEQINLLRLEFGFQPLHRCFEQALRNGLHGFYANTLGKVLEARLRVHLFFIRQHRFKLAQARLDFARLADVAGHGVEWFHGLASFGSRFNTKS